MSVITAILSGAASILAAVLTFFLGQALWSWWTQPLLEIEGVDTRYVDDYDHNQIQHQPTAVGISITNHGTKAAKNCKVQFEYGAESRTVEYEYSGRGNWRESPESAITINRRETSLCELFREESHSDGIEYVRFASSDGWPNYTTITQIGQDTRARMNRVEATELADCVSYKSEVEVTAENAAPVRRRLEIMEDPVDSNLQRIGISMLSSSRPRSASIRMMLKKFGQ